MSGLHDDAYDLGHTVAGWTGTVLALTGCAGAGAALCAAWPPGIGIGLAVVAAGGLVTWVLHLAGWGKPSGPRPADQWDWRIKDPMTGHGECRGCRLAGPFAPARRRAARGGPALAPGAAARGGGPAGPSTREADGGTGGREPQPSAAGA